MKVFVIGFMGAGKTTYARALAEVLGIRAVDLDSTIEEQQGKAIGDLFESVGERAFRRMETDALRELSAGDEDAVISLGGGAPCSPGNMELIKSAGTVVYLKLPAGELLRRLEKDIDAGVQRPLLRTDERLDDLITRLLRERQPFYMKADVVVDPRVVTPIALKGTISQI